MITICRVYDNRKALAEGEKPISEFKFNDAIQRGRELIAKTEYWAARNGKVVVLWPLEGQEFVRKEGP